MKNLKEKFNKLDVEKVTTNQLTFFSMSCKSRFGLLHEAAASQKKMKSGTTPAGLTVII